MVFIHFSSSNIREALMKFIRLLSESVGPDGKIHLLQSAGGCLTVTSSSKRLLSNIEFDNPVFKFIAQTILSHINRFEDGGKYCGILLSAIYYSVLSQEISMLPACNLFPELRSMICHELHRNDSSLHLKISLDSVVPLLMTVKSVLWSKPSFIPKRANFSQRHSDEISFLLVRSFLDSDGHIGRIQLQVHGGSHKSQLFHGVLYPCVDEEFYLLNPEHWISVPVILVTSMLSSERDAKEVDIHGVENSWNGEAQLRDAEIFVALAIAWGIRVIACQRVIHPSLLLEMRRHGILALQQMGTKLTEFVQALSGATPISSLKSLTVDSLTDHKGRLSVKHVESAGKDYLLLDSPKVKFITLVLFSSLECVSELEVVALQTLFALRQTVEDGVLIPGAGCSEMYFCSLLSSEVNQNHASLCEKGNCSLIELQKVIASLQLTFFHAVGLHPKSELTIDTIYHHAWKSPDPALQCSGQAVRCCCGLVSSCDVTQFEGRWQRICAEGGAPLLLLPGDWRHHPQSLHHFTGSRLSNSTTQADIVLDVLSSKCNAFNLAIDNFLGLCSVGAVAFSEH